MAPQRAPDNAAFAPGKIILLGEHAVVFGHAALACPIERGVYAWAIPANRSQLVLPAGTTTSQRQLLQRAARRAFAVAGYPKLSVRIHWTVPVAMGLGSSAALSVAFVRAILGREGTPKAVERLALDMEREFHGTPSGVDSATSARAALLLFARGRARRVRVAAPLNFVVVLTGARAPTREVVAGLAERRRRIPAQSARFLREIGWLAREGAVAARGGNVRLLGELMNVNQGILNALGLSSVALESAAFRLRDAGALGAKLTGAGGSGGAAIGLFATRSQAVRAARMFGSSGFATQYTGAPARTRP